MLCDSSENSKQSMNVVTDHFECQECKKVFKYDSHYKRHIQTHSDQRPFECEACGKKFKRQDALKTHERTHSDDLPFKCSTEGCDEGFASKAALRYHELRHMNETTFMCEKDGCNKKFLTLGQLKQHQRTKIHSKSAHPSSNSNDIDSYQNVTQSFHHHSILNTNGIINQNRNSYANNNATKISAVAAASNSHNQFENPQHFSYLQNSSNFDCSNNNLIQNMNDYLSTESQNHTNHTQTPNRASYRPFHPPQPAIKVKKEHKQEGTFIDEFSEDEQLFIDQIWSTIKQEGPNPSEAESQIKRKEEFEQSCNNAYHDEYPVSKHRRQTPSTTNDSNQNVESPNTSNLLLEFTRLNSSGYSFSRLKQELRIIVGLIDKIKKEDEDLQPTGYNNESNLNNLGATYSSNLTQNMVSNSVHRQNSQQSHSANHSSRNMNHNSTFKMNNNSDFDNEDYHFYQNDDSPFHNYQCQYIHDVIPSEVIGRVDQEDLKLDLLNMENSNTSQKSSDRPLLKKKIKTAVRLVQYCKKAFIEQKKQQMQEQQLKQQQKKLLQQQQEQQQMEQLQQQLQLQQQQQQQYLQEQQQQEQVINSISNNMNGVYEHQSSLNFNQRKYFTHDTFESFQPSKNNHYQPIYNTEEYFPNISSQIPVFPTFSHSNSINNNVQQSNQTNLPLQNILPQNYVSTTSPLNNQQLQPQQILTGINQYQNSCTSFSPHNIMNNNNSSSNNNNNNIYNTKQCIEGFGKQYSQQIIVNSIDGLQDQNYSHNDQSQRHLSDIDSVHSSENIGNNIFDAADEIHNNQIFNDHFLQFNQQLLPSQQFNNLRYNTQFYEQR